MNNIPDKLLVNLKIMSKIQKNGRICRSMDGIIALESETIYQPIKRFLTADSRKQAISEINSIISECIDVLSFSCNSKWMHPQCAYTSEFKNTCENMSLVLHELEQAKYGIENLRFTYLTDHNTSSQLDIIILKINSTLRDFSQKLLSFQQMLDMSSLNWSTDERPTATSLQSDTSNNTDDTSRNISNMYEDGTVLMRDIGDMV